MSEFNLNTVLLIAVLLVLLVVLVVQIMNRRSLLVHTTANVRVVKAYEALAESHSAQVGRTLERVVEKVDRGVVEAAKLVASTVSGPESGMIKREN